MRRFQRPSRGLDLIEPPESPLAPRRERDVELGGAPKARTDPGERIERVPERRKPVHPSHNANDRAQRVDLSVRLRHLAERPRRDAPRDEVAFRQDVADDIGPEAGVLREPESLRLGLAADPKPIRVPAGEADDVLVLAQDDPEVAVGEPGQRLDAVGVAGLSDRQQKTAQPPHGTSLDGGRHERSNPQADWANAPSSGHVGRAYAGLWREAAEAPPGSSAPSSATRLPRRSGRRYAGRAF